MIPHHQFLHLSLLSFSPGGHIKRHRSPAGSSKHRTTVPDVPADGRNHSTAVDNAEGNDNMSDFLGTAETSMISSFVAEKSLKYGFFTTLRYEFAFYNSPILV